MKGRKRIKMINTLKKTIETILTQAENKNAPKLPDNLSIDLVANSFCQEAFDEALQKRLTHATTYKPVYY